MVTYSQSSKYIAGEVLVKFKPAIKTSSISSTIQKKKHSLDTKFKSESGFKKIKFAPIVDMKTILNEYKKDSSVESVQPNYIYYATSLPNDPLLSQQWAIKNTGQTIIQASTGRDVPRTEENPPVDFSEKDLSLEQAWGIHNDCSSIKVAVLDSGVNYQHVDLASNMWDGGSAYPNHGYDFVDNDNDPMDEHGHGTHVAGTIGSTGNNGLGGVGVCWQSSIMAMRVLNTLGAGTTSSIIQAIDFSVLHGAKVINMSLGGGGGIDYAYSDAIENAKKNGVLVIVAAGNENSNNESSPTYPCSFEHDNVMCVASLNQDFSLASYSNFGLNSVDIGAPGTNILSTWPGAHLTIAEPLTSGWNTSSTTGDIFGYTSIFSNNALESNPSTSNYNNNTDDRAWKAFDFRSVDVSILNLSIIYDLEELKDFASIIISPINQDPSISGDVLGHITGSNLSSMDPPNYVGAKKSFNITNEIKKSKILNSDTSIGFKLASDSTGNASGIYVHSMYFETLTFNNNSYNVISGTSMATPYISGLAALIWSFNPMYAYADVLNSLKESGISNSDLVGKTVSGKSANAFNALNFIAKPTGLSLEIAP